MGRPPKPIELKRRTGNPGKRALPQNLAIIAPAPESLEPPDTLADEGAREWRHILAHCQWIGQGDLRLVRLYCEAIDRRSLLLAGLAEMGYVLYTDKGYAYLNPAHGALATTEAQISKWQSALGLTPADRSRLGVAEVKVQSKLEELLAKRASNT